MALAGWGDGPAGVGLPRKPADLTAAHTAQHTAGDMFWWITRGIPAGGMPGFAGALSEDDRWDLINFIRALSSADAARILSPAVEPNRPRVIAPDATIALGPMPARSLKEFRGVRTVLLVFFTLPDSRGRLDVLARSYETLQALGVEIVGVPVAGGDGVLSRLGGNPPIYFPRRHRRAATRSRGPTASSGVRSRRKAWLPIPRRRHTWRSSSIAPVSAGPLDPRGRRARLGLAPRPGRGDPAAQPRDAAPPPAEHVH
jgi:hypothetical protein